MLTALKERETKYCEGCKEVHPLTEAWFRQIIRKNRKNVIYYRCRIHERKLAKKAREKKRDKYQEYHRQHSRTEGRRYSRLKTRAKARGLLVTLTFTQYRDLINNSCEYCGDVIPEVGYGLDRIDNSLGYTKENSVACCTTCNRAKGSMSTSEFTEWILRVADRAKAVIL